MLGLSNRMSLSLGSSNAGASILATTRYFTTFTATGTEYLTMDSAVTLTGDFKIKFKALFNDLSSSRMVVGRSINTSNFIDIRSAGEIRVANGVDPNFDTATGVISEALLYDIEVERVSGTITTKVGGVTKATASSHTGTFVFDSIGRWGSATLFMDGVISDIEITDAGTLIHSWPMDEVDPSAMTDRVGSNDLTGTNLSTADSELFTLVGADWLGVGLWTHGDVSAVAATSGFVGGVSVTVVSGYSYKFFYDVAGFVNGSTTAFATAAGASRTANGSYTDIITATGTSAGWDVATNPTTLDVDSGEIKRILEAP